MSGGRGSRVAWIVAVIVLAAMFGAGEARGQNASPPDLSGVWARLPAEQQISISDSFTPETPPLTPWAEKRYKAARSGVDPLHQGKEELDPILSPYCMVPGYPRAYLRPGPIEITQTRERIVMMFEGNNQWRVIYMDGRKHPEGAPPKWMGHSVGRWEGDTLVNETVGLNELAWLDSMGTPHSDALRVEERIRRVAGDRLNMDFLFEDSKAFTKPWRGKKDWELKSDWELMEYGICETEQTDLYLKEIVEGKLGE